MKIAIVADKKVGHLSQCLGLKEIILEKQNKKDIFILGKDIYFLPGFIERAITLISEKFYLFILRLMNPSVVDYKYDLVLCSGSRFIAKLPLFFSILKYFLFYLFALRLLA